MKVPSRLRQKTRPDILVVDDTPANLQLISGVLVDCGFKVRPVLSGELGLRVAKASLPDLILLDVSMPGLDGYEVCELLKKDPELSGIPVIFISAHNETIDKVKAFRAGGVDYITKPFNLEEVEARVRTHLELHRQRKQLEENFSKLSELEGLRDSLTHMVVHDMRSPLLAMQLSLDIMGDSIEPATQAASLLHTARRSTILLIEMVTQLLDVSRFEAGAMPMNKTKVDLSYIAREAIEACRYTAPGKSIDFVDEPLESIMCDAGLVRRVVGNLVANALKFTAFDGAVKVCVSRCARGVRLEVRDNGSGIAPEYHEKIFKKFGQVDGDKARIGTGLGLTFVKMAVEAHSGVVGITSELGKGSTFWFELPMT